MSRLDHFLAEARIRIHRARELIARQQDIVSALALGEDATEHEKTLVILQQSLALFEAHLRDIEGKAAKAPPLAAHPHSDRIA